MNRLFAALTFLAFFALSGSSLSAHALHFTRVIVSAVPGSADDEVELRVETDLAPPLVDAAEAASLPAAEPALQAPRVAVLADELLAQLRPEFTPPLHADAWRLSAWSFPSPDPSAPRSADDPATIAFVWRTRLPASSGSETDRPAITVLVRSRSDARLVFPVACSVIPPGETRAVTRWLQAPGDATQAFVWRAASASNSNTGSPSAALSAPTEAAGALATLARFLWLGFLHILPLGLDHILFVLGLYFLGSGWRALAAQIAAFTIAHTTTLGLAAAGLVRVSPAIVEPLIALSIAFVALENIFRPRIGPARIVVVFVFGLLHGLGFAGVLSELEMPPGQFLTALLAFNVGVDLGQLAVLALAFLTVGWFRQKTWYRPALAIPACALVAATGLYWTVERAFF